MIPRILPPTAPLRSRLALVIACSTAFAPAACDSGAADPVPPIDAESYATVMGELADVRRFPPSGSTADEREERADSARQAILDRHGVTAEDLLAFAEIVGPNPARMLELTEEIVAISDSLARARTGAGRARADSLGNLSGRGPDSPAAGFDSAGFGFDSAGFGFDTAATDTAVAADSGPGERPVVLPRGPERRERLLELQRRRAARADTASP